MEEKYNYPYQSGLSITNSELQNYNIDQNNIQQSTKYAPPKYLEEKNTYETLDPITKTTVYMPTKVSKKVKTVQPYYTQPVYVHGTDELNQYLGGNMGDPEVPLPTTSTIENLCKDSVYMSSNPSYQQSYKQSYKQSYHQSNKQPAQIVNNEKQSYKQSKHQSMAQNNNPEESIPNPVVYEGVPFNDNSQIKPSVHKGGTLVEINESNNKSHKVSSREKSGMQQNSVHQPSALQQQSGYQKSSHQPSVHQQQSGYQKSSHQPSVHQSSNHQGSALNIDNTRSNQMMYKQSNINQTNIPSAIQSNMGNPQSVHQSNHPSKIQQSSNHHQSIDPYNNHQSSAAHNSLYPTNSHQSSSHHKQSNIQQSKPYEKTMIPTNSQQNQPSVIPSNINQQNSKASHHSINQTNNRQSNIGEANAKYLLDQQPIYETQIIDNNIIESNKIVPSKIEDSKQYQKSNLNNISKTKNTIQQQNNYYPANYVKSVHVSKDPESSAYQSNLYKKSNMVSNQQVINSAQIKRDDSFPTASNQGNIPTKTAMPRNPFGK